MTTVALLHVEITVTAPVHCIATCASVILATLAPTAPSGTTAPGTHARQTTPPDVSICLKWTASSVSVLTAGGETSVIRTSTSASLQAQIPVTGVHVSTYLVVMCARTALPP